MQTYLTSREYSYDKILFCALTLTASNCNFNTRQDVAGRSESAPIELTLGTPYSDTVDKFTSGSSSGYYAIKGLIVGTTFRFKASISSSSGSVWLWVYTDTNFSTPGLGVCDDFSSCVATCTASGYTDYYIKIQNRSGQTLSHDVVVEPPTVSGVSLVTKVVTSGHTLALHNDGTICSWGSNYRGQLGTGTGSNSPMQIGTATWNDISAGGGFSLGIKSDGTLWAWGYNGYGMLGDGTTIDKLSPIQIGSQSWAFIVAADGHSLGIQTDHSLWAWGYNGWDALGLGDNGDRNIPTTVP